MLNKSEISQIISKFSRPVLIAAAFIVVAIFTWQSVRLLDYPKNPEVYRDYLISRHIVEYGEQPMTGPYNSIFPAIRNSPTYPYLWAIFSVISTSPVFLTLVNIALQVVGLIFLFFLGKRLFGSATAAFGVSIYAATWVWFSHTTEVWQPYTMQVFFLIGLWLYVKGLQDKQYWTLLFSFVVLMFAGTFHYSVFAMLPVLTVIALYRIYKDYKNVLMLTGPIVAMALSAFVFYVSVFINVWHQGGTNATLGASNLIVDSLTQFATHVTENIWLVLDTFFTRFGALPLWREIALGTVAVMFAAAIIQQLLVFKKNKKIDKRIIFLLLAVAAILQPVLLSALFTAPRWSYYFIPTFGIAALGIGYVVRSFLPDHVLSWIVRIAVVGLLIYVGSGSFYIFSQKAYLSKSEKDFAAIKTALVGTIEQVKQEQQFSDYSFFQFWVYQYGNPYRSHDAQFWSLLEDHYHQQFITLINAGNGYISDNRSDYLFFSCYNFTVYNQNECLDFIKSNNPGYVIEKTVILQGDYSIYLAHFQSY